MTQNQLSLSLVIPAYNEECYLEACLNSVEAQTVKPLEVIVVNNNSTDKTAEVAKKFSFVRLVDEPQQGIVFARNRGFNAAKGDIIGRIDADTVLTENWVEQVLDFYSVKSNRRSAITGYAWFYNLHLPNVCGWVDEQIAIKFNRWLLGHYILFGSNMAIPRPIWLDVRRSTCQRTDIHEDLDLAIHLHRAGHKIAYLRLLKVGVMARRISGPGRKCLWAFLRLWPNTLKVHQRWTWTVGWLSAATLYLLSPIMLVIENHRRDEPEADYLLSGNLSMFESHDSEWSRGVSDVKLGR